MCVTDPPSKPLLCCMDGQGRDGGGAGRPLFTWPVGRRFCASPQDSLMERRKGAQLMIVTHLLCAPGPPSSSLVLSRHLCELGSFSLRPAGMVP